MSNAEDDAIFVRNFSLVLAILAVIGIFCFILAKIVYSDFLETQGGDRSASNRIAPAGTVNVGEPMIVAGNDVGNGDSVASADTAATPSDPGEATYGKICFSCHDAGIAYAPKIGDIAAWEPRLQKGTEMLVLNAINGVEGEGIMPARGGLPNLSDDEVRAAVMFMLGKLEGDDSAASEADPAENIEAEADNAETEPAPAVDAAFAVADARGKEVYKAACVICHASGVAGAPKFGDATSWAPRVEKGMATLYEHSIKGFMGESGLMPPKGGRPDYSDEDVTAAVDYMVNNSK
ncbi:MAG: c-type cytochrome [Pseudomonadota bacterium]